MPTLVLKSGRLLTPKAFSLLWASSIRSAVACSPGLFSWASLIKAWSCSSLKSASQGRTSVEEADGSLQFCGTAGSSLVGVGSGRLVHPTPKQQAKITHLTLGEPINTQNSGKLRFMKIWFFQWNQIISTASYKNVECKISANTQLLQGRKTSEWKCQEGVTEWG